MPPCRACVDSIQGFGTVEDVFHVVLDYVGVPRIFSMEPLADCAFAPTHVALAFMTVKDGYRVSQL